ATETITLSADASAVLNSTLVTTITASYGPTANLQTTTAEIDLLVRSPQVVAINQAAIAAGQGANTQLTTTLSELGDSVSELQSAPSDPDLLSRVQFLLGNLSTLLSADPALVPFVAQLQPIQASANTGDTNGLLAQVPTFFGNLASVLAIEATEQF